MKKRMNDMKHNLHDSLSQELGSLIQARVSNVQIAAAIGSAGETDPSDFEKYPSDKRKRDF